jgi:tape measure domain-containing protein
MNKQQQFLNRISQDYGLEINNLTKQFTSFYVAAKGKLAGKEIQEIFENISKSGSALGLSNETLERSFQAVNQMLSKGTVASEELRGQLAESLPGAVQAMTKAVQKLHPELKNLTEKDLFQMIKDGKILANEVLPETARQLVAITGADKASGVDTLAKSTNRLSNEWTAFVRELTEGNSAVTKVFIGTINLLKDLLQGTTLLLESSADARKRTIEAMKSSGYDDILKASNKLSIDELTNMKKYNEQKIKENANTINAILEENKRLATDGTIGGAERYNRIQENKQKVQEINNLSYYLIGQNKATSEIILENETKSTKKKKQLTDEELKALEDLAKKRLLLQREVLDSEYELQKQRLERRIKLNDDVAKDEAELDSVRITAVENSQKEQERLLILNKNHLLEIEKLSYQKELEENKGSKANIALVEKNYVNNKLKINEDFSNKLIDLNQKTKEDIDKINAI